MEKRVNYRLRGQCKTCDSTDGPSACFAHPKVLKDIKSQIAKRRVLSTADARLARSMGMLGIPSVGRTGFNDGVIFPVEDAPVLSAARSRSVRPSNRLSLSSAAGTLNCLVLLVDFSDNVGTATPAHFDKLLFDRGNPDSMASFYCPTGS
jgi:hypothetical protein